VLCTCDSGRRLIIFNDAMWHFVTGSVARICFSRRFASTRTNDSVLRRFFLVLSLGIRHDRAKATISENMRAVDRPVKRPSKQCNVLFCSPRRCIFCSCKCTPWHSMKQIRFFQELILYITSKFARTKCRMSTRKTRGSTSS